MMFCFLLQGERGEAQGPKDTDHAWGTGDECQRTKVCMCMGKGREKLYRCMHTFVRSVFSNPSPWNSQGMGAYFSLLYSIAFVKGMMSCIRCATGLEHECASLWVPRTRMKEHCSRTTPCGPRMFPHCLWLLCSNIHTYAHLHTTQIECMCRYSQRYASMDIGIELNFACSSISFHGKRAL